MLDLSPIQSAVKAEGLDYWLFCNFRHRDQVSDSILDIPASATNTRFWFYFVPASGEPVKLVNGVEAGILDNLPGRKQVYASRAALEAFLRGFAGAKVGAQWSETVSAISYLDLGTAGLLQDAGIALRPGDSLVQRLRGTIDAQGMQSHEEAARNLYEIVASVWARIDEAYRENRAISELEVQSWMLSSIEGKGMETDHPPIVACGRGTGDPHYEPSPGKNKVFEKGELIQLDLWAKLRTAGSIYADIAWVGVFGTEPPLSATMPFKALVEARGDAIHHISEAFAEGRIVQGSEVDALVRARLEEAGFGAALRHRTGHGIDVECHGSGANLDSVEFPDRRALLEGSCFSIEPGLYFQDFGLRTEINVYISRGKAVVSGGPPQTDFLVCGAS